MMNLIPVQANLPFEVTFDTNTLLVGMTVLDTTFSGPPIPVGAVIPMLNIAGSNTYVGKFTPVRDHSYLIIKRVFTDVGLTLPDPNYLAGSETVIAQDLKGMLAQLLERGRVMLIGNTHNALDPDSKDAVIIQGAASPVVVRLMNSETLDPIDLTGATEIETSFMNEDGTRKHYKLSDGSISIVSLTLGKFQVNIHAADSANFAITDNATLEVELTYTPLEPVAVHIPKAYKVLEDLNP